MRAPSWVSLQHLGRLTDDMGIVEHAHFDEPQPELGYCTDDAGRLLGLMATFPSDAEVLRLTRSSLRFLDRARTDDGQFRLRWKPGTGWTDDPSSDDANGRALQGLGEAAARSPWPDVRAAAAELFEMTAHWRSPFPRAMAHAALGACSILTVAPDDPTALSLAEDAAAMLKSEVPDGDWPWPEARLTYSNALLPEARLALAIQRNDPSERAAALSQLAWLVVNETSGNQFSFTPTSGRGPGEKGPAFDQQPIEAWSMASACTRAFTITGARFWATAAMRAARWFEGSNDASQVLYDPFVGSGFDGLENDGVNRNRGAESTIAAVATMSGTAIFRAARQPVVS